MKIPVTRTFTNTKGEVVKFNQDDPKSPVLTVKEALVVAITQEFQEDQNPQNIVQDKVNRFRIYTILSQIPSEATDVELSVEDCSYLRPRVARCFGVLVAGPLMALLDGKAI